MLGIANIMIQLVYIIHIPSLELYMSTPNLANVSFLLRINITSYSLMPFSCPVNIIRR